MKYILWPVGMLFGLALIIAVLQIAASERVEVVQLHTIKSGGEKVETRLWVVDYDGHAYLRGDTGSDWFQRLQSSDKFTLIRGDETGEFTHRVKNENIDMINKLMREKYTWGDQIIEIGVGSRAESNAIELTPEK
jgi:hypothetical protein